MTTHAGEQRAHWVPDDSTFGARLALIRQKMGWGNVKTAAEQCGLPVESWRNWERDGLEPRRLTTIAMTIASRTGVDYLWLVHGPSSAVLRQRADTTHWYVETILNGTNRTAPEGRVIAQVGHGDGRLNSRSRRSAHRRAPVGRPTAPTARASVN